MIEYNDFISTREFFGALFGTVCGGGLVWGLELYSQGRRGRAEERIRRLRAMNEIKQQKVEFLLSALPTIYKSLYSGDQEGYYYRSHFQDCFHKFESAKVFFESKGAREMSDAINRFYLNNQAVMLSNPHGLGSDDLRGRKLLAEEYAAMIHGAFTIEVTYLIAEISSGESEDYKAE